MVKMLPGVLLNLSKMSATVYIAVPILEFLSSKELLERSNFFQKSTHYSLSSELF